VTFVAPGWLLLLAPLLLVAGLAYRRHRPAAVGFPGVDGLELLPVAPAVRLHQALPWLRLAAMTAAVLALARPQWSVEVPQTRREGIAIAMAIDVSSSMSAIDLRLGDRPTSRLEVVKAGFRDFVLGTGGGAGRDGDMIGMVTFARFADIRVPPTLDHTALVRSLDGVGIVSFPLEDGTAIGDGMLRAIQMLQQTPTVSRVLIVLTDGSNNVGKSEPRLAAQIAAAFGIRVYTIGAGTNGTAAYPVPGPDGTVEYRTSPVSIDETALQEIARLTGGRYFRATDETALGAIYAEIDRLEKSRILVEHDLRRVEAFPLFAGIALLLLLSELALCQTRLRTVP
jgi:Ca-activated chloride channel family protein